MSDLDSDLRDLLAHAAPSAELTHRDQLLDTVMARIDAGGADVAEAPMPAESSQDGVPILALFRGRSTGRGRGNSTTRAAGIGVVGWIALAAGTAAAATWGTWRWDSVSLDPELTPSVQAPAVIASADDVPRVSAPKVEVTGAASLSDEDAGAEGAGQMEAPRVTVEHRDGGTPQASQPNAPPAGSATRDGSGGGGAIDLPDAVTELMPEGTLRDTVAPVIESIDVSGVTNWLTHTLFCGGRSTPLTVVVTDDVGVASVDVTVRIGDRLTTTASLSHAQGDRWTGVLGAARLLDLDTLTRVADVTVIASDEAGNTSTESTSVRPGVRSCR